MKLCTEILAYYLSKESAQIMFPELQLNAKEIVQLQCYQALCKIRDIIHDDTLEDAECFQRIEAIVCANNHRSNSFPSFSLPFIE